MEQATPVLNDIIASIPEGAKVVVHCMGGLSRAGTFASLYLWMRGMDMRDAIKTVREIRGPHAMNSRQVAFLMRMANGHDGALYESEGSV
jgi:ADP-ribosyl-[dinitrogen reductase] hydrolase